MTKTKAENEWFFDEGTVKMTIETNGEVSSEDIYAQWKSLMGGVGYEMHDFEDKGMDGIEVESYIKRSVKDCYKKLKTAHTENFDKLHLEGFRSRLDELLLMYHTIKNISFVEACAELGIDHADMDFYKYHKKGGARGTNIQKPKTDQP